MFFHPVSPGHVDVELVFGGLVRLQSGQQGEPKWQHEVDARHTQWHGHLTQHWDVHLQGRALVLMKTNRGR